MRLMTSDSKTRLTVLLSAAALAALSMAALLPTKWVPRTGLGWQVEHFSIYFATTFVLCIAFRRPYAVAISVLMSSAILEALQGLTPDRVPDLTTVLCGAAGGNLRHDFDRVLYPSARRPRYDRHRPSGIGWRDL